MTNPVAPLTTEHLRIMRDAADAADLSAPIDREALKRHVFSAPR